MSKILFWFYSWGAPQVFFARAKSWGLMALSSGVILITVSWCIGLFLAPPDYQQSDAVRIIYVHVPMAVMSLAIYSIMGVCSFVYLVWRIKTIDIFAQESAKVGAIYTFLALVTGAFWGKPMWGTWWVWDARLTSELILLFLYLGYISIRLSINDITRGAKASAVLNLVTVINVPVIHYSVNWWYTLHQGGSIKLIFNSTVDTYILIPLLSSIIGVFLFYFGYTLLSSAYALGLRYVKQEWVYKDIMRYK